MALDWDEFKQIITRNNVHIAGDCWRLIGGFYIKLTPNEHGLMLVAIHSPLNFKYQLSKEAVYDLHCNIWEHLGKDNFLELALKFFETRQRFWIENNWMSKPYKSCSLCRRIGC